MNNVTQEYRTTLATLTQRLEQGDRDVDALVDEAESQLIAKQTLTPAEVNAVMSAVRRDLQEFALSYQESSTGVEDSVFFRVIRESIWKELADITDKSQLEWREVFQDLRHHGVYQSGEVVGLGNLVCEKCGFTRAIYTPESLTRCPECGHDQFQRQPFEP
ncbi:zinc ribbon-containing protein [Pantoea sp. Mb-10]|uniref:zinc ribbon-containing protein n=1 Tax=unclassified Pantoea TaxID=2630326 RepID=UPI001E61904D|nr:MULTISPECIES: zinc ribbon-containing protein [unclassified Pantoea]MCE0488832.1 zinc ribbon-containing protein [Pantoea sp. Mb-10]MCE0500579.1 zinc ribbon-containing protein [Pantoea sp. Pb-8]